MITKCHVPCVMFVVLIGPTLGTLRFGISTFYNMHDTVLPTFEAGDDKEKSLKCLEKYLKSSGYNVKTNLT